IEKIVFRSSGLGRSTKKISSKRPLRSNSGGRAEISLDVAVTNTGDFFSCIQFRKVPKMRTERPPSASDLSPALGNIFSISSIHNTAGETASATCSDLCRFFSDSPIYFSNQLLVSNFSNWRFHSLATALAHRPLPQ